MLHLCCLGSKLGINLDQQFIMLLKGSKRYVRGSWGYCGR
jgi:hypothetical protein